MGTFFNREDIKKATISNKELDGKNVTLKYVEGERVGVLSGIDENGHIYILRIDEVREVSCVRPKESYMEWDMRKCK